MSLNSCIQCGTCIASCPSGRITALNTRKIIAEFISSGRKVEERDEIWFCVTCYACQERCPRGIEITDTLIEARRSLVRRKGLPGRLSNAFEFLMKFAALVPAREEHVELRRKLNLPNYHAQFDEKAREEVRRIVENYLGRVLR